MGLAHLDRLAAVGVPIVETRPAAGIDLDFEGDAEFLAIAEDRLMGAWNASRTCVPIHLGIEFAELSCAIVHVEPGAAPNAPVAAANAFARLQDGAIVAGLAEFVSGRQACDSGT